MLSRETSIAIKVTKEEKEREEEQRLNGQEEKIHVEIERRLAVTISQIAQTGALLEVPLDPVISPSTSSYASTEVRQVLA
jgi:arginyl-tRNA synthetase